MIGSPEKIQPPVESRKRIKESEGDSDEQNQHYSEKGGHKSRSIANDPHKQSRRR